MTDLMSTFAALNVIEFATALVVSCICVWIGWKVFGRVNAWMVLTIIAALFSVANTSQFATIDEYGIAFNAAADGADFLRQWLQGPLHTTGALFVPLGRLLVWIFPSFVSADFGLPVFKALHWAIATILVALVAIQASMLTDARFRARNYALLFAILLLLPPVATPIKTFNYDAYSLLGAVLALLLMARSALEDSSPWLGRFAIAAATLAAQEKLNASPILLICLYGDAVLVGHRAESLRAAFKTLLTDTLIVLAIAAISMFAYMLATRQILPSGFFIQSMVDPLSVWVYMPLAFLENRPELFATAMVIAAPATVAVIAVAVTGTIVSIRRLPNLMRFAVSFARFAWKIMPWLMVCAVIGAYLVNPQWAPFSASKIPALANSHEMNGVFLHFGMRALAPHNFAYFFYAFAVCFVALPSVLWMACTSGLWRPWDNRHLEAALGFMLWVAYGMVLLAVILRVPIGSRYLCISILIIALAASTRSLDVLQKIPWLAKRSVVLLIFAVALMVLEIAPFAPLYASFRPIWLEYGDLKPEPGVINDSWIGWGEEAMQSGKLLEDHCRAGNGKLDGVDCKQLRVHVGYFGVWLGHHPFAMDMTITNPKFNTNADYYVLNRSLLVQSSASMWPKTPADFVLTARGYPMAWIFRGDRLAASGWFQRDSPH